MYFSGIKFKNCCIIVVTLLIAICFLTSCGETKTENSTQIDQRVIKETYYDENNDIKSWKEYRYNDQDMTVESYRYDAAGTLLEYSIEEYDTNDNLLSSTCYDENGNMASQYTHTYDELQREVTDSMYLVDETGEITNTLWENIYDEQGNLIRVLEHEDGRTYVAEENTYNDAGKRIRSVAYPDSDGFGNPISVSEYTYDEDGRLIIQSTDYNIIYSNMTTEYEYDQEGNIAREITYEDGEAFFDYSYKYDSDGNLLEEIDTYYQNGNETQTQTTYTYEYNEDGYPSEKEIIDIDEYGNQVVTVCVYEYEDIPSGLTES